MRLQKFSSALTQARSYRQVEYLVKMMSRAYGGVGRLAALWRAHLLSAPPGSLRALQVFRAYVGLLKYLDARKPEASEMAELIADDEVDREIDEMLANQLRLKPGLFMQAAQQAGWTVIPPGEPSSDLGTVG
jgi:hypothetical protein